MLCDKNQGYEEKNRDEEERATSADA